MSKFHAANNVLYTTGLFLEISRDPATVLYTLDEQDRVVDGKTYPSIKRLYLEARDPGEYEFAKKYFYSYEHWEKVCEGFWLKDHVAQWRKELALQLKSEALKRILEEASDSTRKNNYNANRFLVDKGWLDKETAGKVGRPKKQEVKDAFHKEAAEDLERLSSLERKELN